MQIKMNEEKKKQNIVTMFETNIERQMTRTKTRMGDLISQSFIDSMRSKLC